MPLGTQTQKCDPDSDNAQALNDFLGSIGEIIDNDEEFRRGRLILPDHVPEALRSNSDQDSSTDSWTHTVHEPVCVQLSLREGNSSMSATNCSSKTAKSQELKEASMIDLHGSEAKLLPPCVNNLEKQAASAVTEAALGSATIVDGDSEVSESDALAAMDIIDRAAANIDAGPCRFLLESNSIDAPELASLDSLLDESALINGDDQHAFRPNRLGMPRALNPFRSDIPELTPETNSDAPQEDVWYLHIPQDSLKDFQRFARDTAASARYDSMIHNPYIQALRRHRAEAQAFMLIPEESVTRSPAQELASRREALAVLQVSLMPALPELASPRCRGFEMASPRRPAPRSGADGCIGGGPHFIARWSCEASAAGYCKVGELRPVDHHPSAPPRLESHSVLASGMTNCGLGAVTKRGRKKIVVDLGQQPTPHAPVKCETGALF